MRKISLLKRDIKKLFNPMMITKGFTFRCQL